MFEYVDLKKISMEHKNTQESSGWSEEFLTRHHLEGMAYHRSKDRKYFPRWKSQWTRNMVVKSQLEILGENLEKSGIEACLLKGFALMGDVYEDWGERFASDVDILVPLSDLWRLSDLLTLNGFEKVQEKKWLGNRFKFIFLKKVAGTEVNIEVHTQLFWHRPAQELMGARKSHIPGFLTLGLEAQLIHLCGHLAFQHTYLKLFWLVDIFKFTEKYKEEIKWDHFWNLAGNQGLYKSCYLSLFLCQRLGLGISMELAKAPSRFSTSISILKKCLTLDFLYDPRRYWFRYLMVKNLIKDSQRLNLVYTWNWLRERVRKKKSRKA